MDDKLSTTEPSRVATYFARFWVDGVSTDVPLTGSGPYSGSVTLRDGTKITRVDWFAVYGGQNILLQSQRDLNETIDRDLTNRFSFDSKLSGRKWADYNENGVRNAGEPYLPGWEIKLYRGASQGPYATAHTDANGY